jgi:hypothetical protein
MIASPEVAVTLSEEMYAHLRGEAEMLGIPMEWLIASIVADTIDETEAADELECELAAAS